MIRALKLMLLPQLREDVCRLHAELPKNNLVAWTSGNISARDPATGLVVIKPSGLRFEDLTPASMVVTDLQGQVLDGDLAPSSDTASHLFIYRHMPAVQRRGAYAFALCHSFRGRWRGDPLRDDGDG